MGVPVLIMGDSGTGKSTAIRTMQAERTAIVNVLNKPLPFKAMAGDAEAAKILHTRDIDVARAAVARCGRPSVVVDDFGYLITDLYMRYSYGDEKFRDQYEVYKLIGNKAYGFITMVQEMDPSTIVYFTMHTDTDAAGRTVPATIGKLLNEKVNLAGMFTIVLLSTIDGGEYRFVTNGKPPAKSPQGMFEAETIPNDLATVDKAIRDYWGLA